jgi:RNA polymerase sigma-70 factor (ECF subfamily)
MPRLWRYALVLSKKRDVADDLTQATALRALEKAHQFQVGSNLVGWTFTILNSIWKNQLRSTKVRTGAGLQSVEDSDIAANNLDAETNILAGQVLTGIMHLPEAQRDAVFLTYVEGHSYKEVAAILGIPIGTVMSRLAAGRKTLNDAMGDM